MVHDLTPEQQKETYKIGDVVTIRPDANKYTIYFNNYMYRQLGEKGTIMNVDEFGISSIYKPTDLAILVMVNNDPYNVFYWHYKSIEPHKPTYKPKSKTERILESFINKYDKDVIFIKTDDIETSRLYQELCFDNGIVWISGGESHFLNIMNNYMIINLKKGEISVAYDYLSLINFFKNENSIIDPKIYTVDDYDIIKNILKYGLIPNYKPKGKPIRESFINKYKYDVLLVLIDCKKTSEMIQELCFENDIKWVAGGERYYLDIMNPNEYIEINLKHGEISNGGDDVLYTTKYYEIYDTSTKVDPKIYTIDDYDIIKNILICGLTSPTYKPKGKPIRESINNDIIKIGILINNEQENNIIQTQILPYYKWSVTQGIRNFYHYPVVIFCNFDNDRLSYLETPSLINKVKNNDYDDECYYKLFDITSLNQYVSFIKNKKIYPTYEPKGKPIRESNKQYPYRFKTEKEFIEEYGNNWRVQITPNWNRSGFMDYLYGQDYPYNVKKGDYLPMRHQWYISWEMLTPNILPPSYKPKGKPIRESFNNDITKFAFLVNNELESIKIQKLLNECGYKWRTRKTYEIFNKFPIILFINIENNNITCLDNVNLDHYIPIIKNGQYSNCYNIIFDIDSIDTYSSIIRYKSLPPTYKSKKIKRSLD